MRFRIKTLFDITETRCRKGDDPFAVRQQQNYLTILNTIGLRVNPTYINAPTVTDEDAKVFGSKYKGKQKVWTYTFDVDYESALDIDTLVSDFDLIPIITNLDETVDIDPAAIRTQDKQLTNIIFDIDDK
jgi:hypothetical protein